MQFLKLAYQLPGNGTISLGHFHPQTLSDSRMHAENQLNM